MAKGRNWRFYDGVLLTALVAGSLYVTRGIWADIFSTAIGREEQSHVLMAAPVAIWLAWLRRHRLRYYQPEWSLLGPLGIAAGWLMSWAGFRYGVELAWHAGALVIVCSAALTVIGPRVVFPLMPAFAVLAFLMPVPGRLRQHIALPLQEASAKIAQVGMDLCGLPVVRSGNMLIVNEHPVAIAEACNGMRMVAALGLISFAFVYSVPMRNSVRLVILALSPLIALFVNVIRLVPTALMYGYADHGLADLFHDVSGWAVLGVALLMLWGVLAIIRWLEIPLSPYGVHE